SNNFEGFRRAENGQRLAITNASRFGARLPITSMDSRLPRRRCRAASLQGRLRAAVLAAALAAVAAPARADVIVPGASSGVEGESNNAFPFDIGDFAFVTQRYQQVYDAGAFDGAILISGISFRPDADYGSAFSATLPSIRIDLSTTRAPVDALSALFADNVGA